MSPRAHLRLWLGWLDGCVAEKDARNFISSCREKSARKEAVLFGIFDTSSDMSNGKLIGAVDLQGMDWDRGHTDIGYWLCQTHQGKARKQEDLFFNPLIIFSTV